MDKRQFLTAAAALAATSSVASDLALAQTQAKKPGTDDLGRTAASMKAKVIPRRKAKTTKLFLTPPSWPNAITADPQGRGFWVQQQRHDRGPETAWLLDRKGKVLHSVITKCEDCSGMAVGADGGVKLAANTHTEGTIPRSLTLDPTGKFLYSLNQGASNVTTFRISAGGVPKFTGKFLGLGTPAVMVFLP